MNILIIMNLYFFRSTWYIRKIICFLERTKKQVGRINQYTWSSWGSLLKSYIGYKFFYVLFKYTGIPIVNHEHAKSRQFYFIKSFLLYGNFFNPDYFFNSVLIRDNCVYIFLWKSLRYFKSNWKENVKNYVIRLGKFRSLFSDRSYAISWSVMKFFVKNSNVTRKKT